LGAVCQRSDGAPDNVGDYSQDFHTNERVWYIFGIALVNILCYLYECMKQEKTVPYNLRIPARLKTQLEKQAKSERRSLNQHIIVTLETVQQQAKQEQMATATA
jgi:hypothetical protein